MEKVLADPTQAISPPEASLGTVFIFLIVMVLLPIPWVMRQFYKIEPYPAVLLPAGATVVKDDGRVSYNSYTATAMSSDGRETPVDWRLLLPKHPAYRRAYFAERGFGISTAPNPSARWEVQLKLRELIEDLTSEKDIVALRFRKVRTQKATSRSRSKPLKEKVLMEWNHALSEAGVHSK